MRIITEGAETKEKTVGGTKYGYIYLPRSWVGQKVTIIRHETPVNQKQGKSSKKLNKMKQYAKKKLEDMGYTTSDAPVNVFGKVKTPLLTGAIGKRVVAVSGILNTTIKREDIDKGLATAANVLYIVIQKESRLSHQAQARIKSLGNVKVWRF